MVDKVISMISGPGVGKTTLTDLMAKNGFAAVREQPEIPKGAVEHIDHLQHKFMLSQFLFLDQHKELLETCLHTKGPAATDSDLLLVHVWGDMLLEELEKKTFFRMYDFYEHTVPSPDLTIYMFCSPEEQLRRIRMRGREFEKVLTLDTLIQANACIERAMSKYAHRRNLLKINTEKLNLLSDADAQDYVMTQIFAHLEGCMLDQREKFVA